MIAGIFHEGSGLGDQLFRYITVRTLAEDKGYQWGMIDEDSFKGREIFPNMGLDYEHPRRASRAGADFIENDAAWDNGIDIRSYDPEINFVEDNTVIDGSFEDDKYWRHRLGEIDEWLKVEQLNVADDLCVIGFRGGEYASNPDLFLPWEYYRNAIAKMRTINPHMRFQVHTDDVELAKRFFPIFEIVENTPISHSKHSNMGFNWRSTRFAKYAIIPNSAFFIIPRILAHRQFANYSRIADGLEINSPSLEYAVTIAPRYWARHNMGVWARPACFYPEFAYIV